MKKEKLMKNDFDETPEGILAQTKFRFVNLCDLLLHEENLSVHWDKNEEREWMNAMAFFEQHDVLNYSDFKWVFNYVTGEDWDNHSFCV